MKTVDEIMNEGLRVGADTWSIEGLLRINPKIWHDVLSELAEAGELARKQLLLHTNEKEGPVPHFGISRFSVRVVVDRECERFEFVAFSPNYLMDLERTEKNGRVFKFNALG